MEFIEKRMWQRLDAKLKRLKALRPLNPNQVAKLRKQFEIEMTYNSNAIEGNSLTLRETFLILEEGMTIKGKPLKDHLEVKDHKEALDFLYELISGRNITLSEHLIRQFHQLVTRETERAWAGKYRNGSVMIAGARHAPPDAIDVPRKMNSLIEWYRAHQQKLHPVELAALVHHKFVAIHPFFDGNGRTGRLIMNILLMRAGYPLAIILKNDRKKYYRVLQSADTGKASALALFIAQAVERSLDIYLRAFDTKNTERWMTLSQASTGTSYSPKYLNLLARTGRIAAHKRGRVWHTTKKAVENYRKERQRKR